MGEALKTVGLTKSYFGNRVVHDVSMTVRSGELYGLVGKNGAGKSTFMKMVCGLVRPTSGTIEVLGCPLGPGEAHPRVGALIERPGLYGGMSAFNNVMCRALALGLADPRKEVRRAIDLVGLRTAVFEHPSTFSQGMKQRLGLALALVGTPDLLFLDEPFNGIDIEGTRDLRDTIVGLNERLGVTVIVSSHVIDQLARLVTCYGVMRGGCLVCEQTVAEVEEACADCLCVRCAAPERGLAVLQERFPRSPFTLMEDGEIRMAPDISPDDAVRELVAAGIGVTSVHVRTGDIEEYFADLMGGRGRGDGDGR